MSELDDPERTYAKSMAWSMVCVVLFVIGVACLGAGIGFFGLGAEMPVSPLALLGIGTVALLAAWICFKKAT